MNHHTTTALARCMIGAALGLAAFGVQAQGTAYPARAIELVVPFAAGGGTDAMARAFADAARNHLPQAVVVLNKPGASGGIGFAEVAGARPDGYKLGLVTADLAIIPHLGISKTTYDKFVPVAQLNADPSAITVRADSPLTTIEGFIEAAKKDKAGLQIGNAGTGSIWHLATAAFEDKIGAKFNHIPFNGANPAVLALLGGHIDAVAVSPAEVAVYVAAGKLKMLAVMADQRVPGFDNVPTLKERNIDLSIGTWRGIAAPLGTPPQIIAQLQSAAAKIAQEPAFRQTLEKQNLGYRYADSAGFEATMRRDDATFKALIDKLALRQQ